MSSAENTDSSVDPPVKKRKLDSVANSPSEMANNNGASASTQTTGDIDEGLYSRQLYVLGHDAMRRMATSDVLISGLGGLGVEIAKNVILGGVKSVTLHDQTACTIKDLSSQFYLTENDIGKNRAEACHKQLSELNTYVPVKTYTGVLSADFLKNFRVVVLTNSSLNEQMEVSDITHANNVALIVADTRGLFAQVFCDFGTDFTVVDQTGEQPISAMVADISNDKEGIVTCIDDARHGLEDGDYVTFTEVQGMTELNNCEPIKIKVLGPYTFSIGDTTGFKKYERGGIVTQVKMPKLLNFKSFKESIKNPDYVVTDFGKFDHPSQLHIAYQALHKYIEKHGAAPKPWKQEDTCEFLTLAKSLSVLGGNDTEINLNLFETFAKTCAGDLNPINATIGGIVAQEVMKACTGKFNPIYQWLYFDAIECLPTEEKITEELAAPTGSRYDGQIAVFGRNFQKKLGETNVLIT